MFDKLNDDCWLTILKYVNLKDQVSLAHISKSLRSVVRYQWEHLRVAYLDQALLERFEQQPSEMEEFLQLASSSLQNLTIKQTDIALLQKWRAYEFPKLVTLDCDLGFESEEETDEKVLLLTQLFPNLRQLTLLGNTTGRHIWAWDQLQELNLLCCESLDTSTFDQIFSAIPLRKLTLLYYGYNTNMGDDVLPISKCSTLEELVMDDHHLLGDFMPNLLQLPRLRRLAFYTRDYYEYLLETVSKLRPLRVKALLFHDAFWSSSCVSQVMMSMTNLRRLVLHDDDIETKELHKICATLPQLEELHLTKMRALPTATQLWDMVGASQSLKILNLSGNRLNRQFLDLSSECLDRVLKKRSLSSPLTLHLHNTLLKCDQTEILKKLKHPNLEVSFKPIDLNVWSSRFVEIEFNIPTD
ncbi:uncharacterized protein LOC6583348 [Drosophila mojavensis]|uniref:F-box domain-containing protein n=1 Tax=Drosophila mojavensis TaxID=7230 RepID=B4KVM3_DROMO|nr:uncharacterized protein LOC6583348 [Drosophila mojavensis]EDW19494.1 uncharacterized protein Dmoj_GI13815 [Drosophila mojavensis]